MAKIKSPKKKAGKRATKKRISADGGQVVKENVKEKKEEKAVPQLLEEKAKRPFDFLRQETQKNIRNFQKEAKEGESINITLRTGRGAEYYIDDIQKILGEGFKIEIKPTGEKYKVQYGEHAGKILDVYEVTITKVAPVSKKEEATTEALLHNINDQISSLSTAKNETQAASKLHNDLMKAWQLAKAGKIDKGTYYSLWADAASAFGDPKLKGVFENPMLVEENDNPKQEIEQYLAKKRKEEIIVGYTTSSKTA
jgi:hypothetical protein